MRVLLLYILAFCSGFAALIYQVAWSRILALTFGSTTLAVSAVVAGFLGGMGVGAWLYHRVGDRIEVPLKGYGLLEIGIAASTAIFTFLFLQTPEWFAALSQMLPAGAVNDLARALTAVVLLLIPAAFMGATYPALCQSLIHSAREVEGRLGWIYGLNTVGAAFGAFAAGFVMIELLGAVGSVLAANGVNLLVAACALFMARSPVHGTAVLSEQEPAEDDVLRSDLPYWVTGAVLFGSGFATIGYEIVWFRALHYVMGVGTYVLSTALVIFLLGLGFGGLFYRLALRFGRPEWNLGLCQIAIAVFALLAIGGEQWILIHPEVSEQVSAFSLAVRSQSWQWRVGSGFALAVAIMLPATLWMGLSFPLASRLFLGSIRSLTSRVGLAYLLSNLGSIAGALLAALWILPELGTVDGTRLLAALNVALGFLVLQFASNRLLRVASLAAVLLVIVLASALPARLHFRNDSELGTTGKIGLVFEKESDLGTVQVYSRMADNSALAMAIDGVVIASTKSWAPDLYAKQMILAHLPMNLDRDIRHTLNLGVASASTLKTLSRYDWVETLDAVEINPAVIEAGSYFFESTVFFDPRARLFTEDAVHYLLRTPMTYDLIISDAKQDLRFGGNAKVLSKELYEYSLARLSPCGLFVQFLPVFNGNREFMTMVMRTFMSVYPEVEIFIGSPYYLLTVGSRCPIPGRVGPTREELEDSGIAREIEAEFVPDASRLGALWLASGHELEDAIGEGPVNSWDKLPVEFLSYRAPPPHPTRAARVLSMFLTPRIADASQENEFAADPYFGALIELQRAYLDWMNRRYDEALERLERVTRDHPDLALGSQALQLVSKRIRAPELQKGEGDL